MPTIEFEYTKEEPGGGQTKGRPFQVDIKGAALDYRMLRDAEATFLRWFHTFHSSQALVEWEASVEHRGIVARYSSSLPYGMPKS